ncbi:MAG: oligosaccharide flippase family protein [Armatimonadetes bacterium]|nr:oligosaccharide flippase family protein [Armatimonadota bacterium]
MKTIFQNLTKSFIPTLNHPLINSASALATSRYIRAGLNLLKAVIAARLLGPSDYGIATLAIAYPTLMFSFVSVKSSSVTIRYISGFKALGQKEKIGSICKLGYALDFGTAVIGFLLIVATGWWVAHFVYKMPHLFWFMVIYGASLPLYSLVMTSSAILTSLQNFRMLAGLEILNAVIDFLLVASLLGLGLGVLGFILGSALGHAVAGTIMMGVATYLLSKHGISRWWDAPMDIIASLKKEIATFWGWNYLMVTLSGLATQLPLMLIGLICGPREAGFYRLASNITAVGSYLETSLGQVIYPSLSERWAIGEKQSIGRSLRHWTLKGGITLSALLLFTVPFFPLVIPLIFGEPYKPMVAGAQIMMTGEAISALFFWTMSFYYASGRIAFLTKAYGLYTAAVIGLGIVFMSLWGFPGLAASVTLSKVAFSVLMALFTWREIKP